MKIKCKCGLVFSVSPEMAKTPEPRVTCPRCNTRYRLRRPPKAKEAAATTPPESPPSRQNENRSTERPTNRSTVVVPGAQRPEAGGSTQSPAVTRPISIAEAAAALREQLALAPESPAKPTTEPRVEGAASATASRRPSSATPTTTDGGTSAGDEQEPSEPAFGPGELLAGRYRIESFLAKGGMGEVYAAEDVELQERVALKTISRGRDPLRIDRFKREITLARRVTHPNVCRIFDLGQHVTESGDPVTFLTMELLQGETLASFLRVRRQVSPGLALPIARQIGAALDAAHAAEVVHRDLKTDNIFLVQNGAAVRTVVTDFGIARAERDDPFAARVTGTKIVGTPAYMAPEQVAGETVTAAADIYAFGVVLYEMVTGRLPFEGDNPLSVAAKRLQDPPTPPTEHVPELEPLWERVILRCLARRPDDRFTTCGEAVAALEQASPDGDLSTAGPPTPLDSPSRDQRRTTGFPSGPDLSELLGDTRDRTTETTATGGASTAATTGIASTEVPVGGEPGTSGRRALSPTTRTLLLALLVVAAVALGLQLFNRYSDSTAAPAPRRSVAVVGFQNLSGQQDQDWMATALTEMIGTELTRGENLRAVPRDQVARMRQELSLEDPVALSELSEDGMRQVHAVLGCDFVVTGSYVAAPDQVRVDLRLSDAAAGATLASFAREGSTADLFEIVRGLGDDVRERLGADRGQGPDPLAGLPSDRQAARLYSEALDSLQRFEARAARDALLEAARIEPANPMIHLALSSTWQALGNDQKAAEEAERALRLSSDLPQEDRLVIQGHFQETRGAWGAAVNVYRELWQYYPGNLEYGLRLASAQTSAGQIDAALASIAQLRELPPPASEDPRIDLAEAEVAAMSADYRRQLAAARRAAGKAEDQGASLLAAQARVAESQASRFLGRTQEAIAAALDGLEVYSELDQPTGSALALIALANAHYDLAELDEAAARAEEAIDLYRDLGDDAGLASALNILALVLKKEGEVDRAQSLYQEAQQIFETTGNRLGLANAINNQATMLILSDELDQAKEMLEQARAIWEEAGDPSGRAFVLNNLAVVERLQGNLEASRAANEEALAIRQGLGQKLGEVFSLSNLGGTLADLGELERAAELLGQCRTLSHAMGHRSALGSCLHKLAVVRLYQGELDEALALHGEARAVREELGETTTLAETRSATARLRLERAEPAEAQSDAEAAIATFAAEDRAAEQGLAAALLAQAVADQGRLAEARRTLSEAERLASESQQFAIRFRIALVGARLEAAAGRRGRATQRLQALERQASEAGFSVLALEARLQRLLLTGDGEALEALRADAETAGVGWIRERSAAAL